MYHLFISFLWSALIVDDFKSSVIVEVGDAFDSFFSFDPKTQDPKRTTAKKNEMAEGGRFPWKLQDSKKDKPSADYSKLKVPLPTPPADYVWSPEEKWKLVPKESKADDTDDLTPLDERTPKNDSYDANKTNPKYNTTEKRNYVEHIVTSSDTFFGICLKYKVPATVLRQVNCFSGSNLKLAPPKLIIPVDENLIGKDNSKISNINILLKAFPSLSRSEAKT